MKLTNERKELYEQLESKILNTKLDLYEGDVVNNNKIWIKKECDSLHESHYDYPYLQLLKHYEINGMIKPGKKIFDASSGSAGISLAGIGSELGYDVHIALPAGGEKARETEIVKRGGIIHETDEVSYVNGFMRFTPRFLVSNRDCFFINHSLGSSKTEMNEIALKAFEKIATESLEQIQKYGEKLDYFVPALGNGSTLVGPGRVFKKNEVSIKGFEPFQSGLVYDMLYPGKYAEEFGIEPGTLKRHKLPGMSFQQLGKHVPVPTYDFAIKTKLLDDVILLSDSFMNSEYETLTSNKHPTNLPRWDIEQYKDFGRSTNGGIQVCKMLAKSTDSKNYLIIGYDKKNRYDF